MNCSSWVCSSTICVDHLYGRSVHSIDVRVLGGVSSHVDATLMVAGHELKKADVLVHSSAPRKLSEFLWRGHSSHRTMGGRQRQS